MSSFEPKDLQEEPTPEQQGEAKFNFITGPAGTGKTWLVKAQAAENKGHQLCATTGIAAVNLGEGVTTLNSLIGYFDTASLSDLWTTGQLSRKLIHLVRSGLRQIILDEVSMLDEVQLNILCWALDEVNEKLGEDGESDIPPIGLTLTGDFCQLPPVKAKFAFEAQEWHRFAKNTQVLTEIRRQADQEFIRNLQLARRGAGMASADFFGKLMNEQLLDDYPGTTIVAKNDEVERYNMLRMSKLPGEVVSYSRELTGKPRSEWKDIPDRLNLKPGALVMTLANFKEPQDDQDPDRFSPRTYRYVNGDLGIFREKAGDHGAIVELKRTGRAVVVTYASRDNTVPLEVGRLKELKQIYPDTWQQYVDADGRKEIVGSVDYMPLRLAWATTVHKSQGLSLDAVQINLRDGFFRSPGMVYVALSRCRTAEGLRLVGSPATFIARCKTDERVKPWL